MKKLFLSMIIFFSFCAFSFCQNNEMEEVGYLLFLPNSSNFISKEHAKAHLDDMVKTLINRNHEYNKIHVIGYSASAYKDVETDKLSLERALFVISELKKRGIPEHWISEPQGLGATEKWGGNPANEKVNPNSRVIILLDCQNSNTKNTYNTIKKAFL